MINKLQNYYKLTSLKFYINKVCSEFNIDPEILKAIVWTESKGNPDAIRYEEGFYVRYVRNQRPLIGHHSKGVCSYKTEKHSRSMSWGLCQIMGQTARELGFKGDFCSELNDPKTNLYYGAKCLRSKINQEKGDLYAGILRYNGGGDPNYTSKVLNNKKVKYEEVFFNIIDNF